MTVLPSRLVVATKNRDKLREALAVLAEVAPLVEVVEGLDWPDVAETGSTLEENALLKARAVVQATGFAALADDTGLEVDALGGAPGVRSARFGGASGDYRTNRLALLAALDGVAERSARFRTVVALVEPDGRVALGHGTLEGVIIDEERGEGGFGYDSIFEVGGRTLSELGAQEKNAMSHRSRALRSLVAGR
jgi:XTP/dITP diphosphohydrolase